MTPSTDPRVVIVAYHAPALLDRCLACLQGEFVVDVVDNSSDPAVRETVGRHGASYHDAGGNLGFAAGVNRGVAVGPADADVLLLNPDAEISPEAVRRLADALHADPGLAAVAPVQRSPDAGGEARVAWPFPTPLGSWIDAVGLGRLRRRTDFLIGSVLLIGSSALADVGPFDEQFFLYAEETDWQRRAASRGWRVAVVPGAAAVHVGAGSSGDPRAREVHFHASHERYLRKHHGAAGWWAFRTGARLGAVLRALVLPGPSGREAGARAQLYRRGPLRVESELERRRTRSEGALTIVHVVLTDAFAGVERYVCQVAGGLVARGHRVEVIGGDPDRMAAELPGVVHHRPAATVADGVRALARLGAADLIHVHMTKAEVAASVARPLLDAPTVATRHFAHERGSSAAARLAGRLAARSITCDIAISQFVADNVTGPTFLLPNGVPDRPPSALTEPTVVMLQRLDEEKAPQVGLEAWATSSLRARGWHLVVAGSGILRPALEDQATALGCAASVTFAGQVSDTDTLLASASILLAPAPAEPFGLSVVEAMAHGLAVVAAAGGGHVETVGRAGLLFPPGDAGTAARCLDALAGDAGLLARTGAALRARQQERYSLGGHLDRLEALYRDVVAERPLAVGHGTPRGQPGGTALR